MRSGNPRQRPRAIGAIVSRTNPVLEPFTNQRWRQPCAPHDQTGPSTWLASVIEDLGTADWKAQPPTPILTRTMCSSTRIVEYRGPARTTVIVTRTNGFQDSENTAVGTVDTLSEFTCARLRSTCVPKQ